MVATRSTRRCCSCSARRAGQVIGAEFQEGFTHIGAAVTEAGSPTAEQLGPQVAAAAKVAQQTQADVAPRVEAAVAAPPELDAARGCSCPAWRRPGRPSPRASRPPGRGRPAPGWRRPPRRPRHRDRVAAAAAGGGGREAAGRARRRRRPPGPTRDGGAEGRSRTTSAPGSGSHLGGGGLRRPAGWPPRARPPVPRWTAPARPWPPASRAPAELDTRSAELVAAAEEGEAQEARKLAKKAARRPAEEKRAGGREEGRAPPRSRSSAAWASRRSHAGGRGWSPSWPWWPRASSSSCAGRHEDLDARPDRRRPRAQLPRGPRAQLRRARPARPSPTRSAPGDSGPAEGDIGARTPSRPPATAQTGRPRGSSTPAEPVTVRQQAPPGPTAGPGDEQA